MQKHPNARAIGELSRRGFVIGALSGTALAGSSTTLKTQVQTNPEPLESTKTVFFTTTEWITIIALCNTLIPAGGDGPGALEARVPVFIDRQMVDEFGSAAHWYMEGPFEPDANPMLGFQSPLTPAQIYRKGLAHFSHWCESNTGKSFAGMDTDERIKAVDALMENQIGLPAELRDFPTFLLQNTKEGYLADPRYGGNYGMVAWSYIGFPGARGNYLNWTNPDRDDVSYPLGPVSISGDRA